MTAYIAKNMGLADRLIRGGVGLVLLLKGIQKLGQGGTSKLLLGSTLLMHGISGYDPLLAALKTSTQFKDEKSVFNRVKQAMPGHGDPPINLQQPIPKHLKRITIEDSDQTIADFLAVGI